MAEVAEVRGGLLPELLLQGGEPALGALPRVVEPVEVVGAVGAVAAGEEKVGGAEAGVEPALGGQRVRVVAAIGHEAVGGVAAAGELLGCGARLVGGDQVLLLGAVVAEARFDQNRGCGGRAVMKLMAPPMASEP